MLKQAIDTRATQPRRAGKPLDAHAASVACSKAWTLGSSVSRFSALASFESQPQVTDGDDARSLSEVSRSPSMNSLKGEIMKGFQPETDVRTTDGPTVAAMKRAGVPLNRENYLYWAFGGDPREGEIDPEI